MTDLQTYLLTYDCHLVCEETSHEELRALDADLPSDTHLVRYMHEGAEYVAAIRAYKKSDIFDALHDGGSTVLEITQGYGRIRPNVFGYQAPERKTPTKGAK